VPPSEVQLIVCDVDGVLTDGVIALDERGEERKRFSVLDGMGITLLRRAGVEVAFLSGRASPVVDARARGLGVHLCWSGVEKKRAHLEAILARSGRKGSEIEDRKISLRETCFIGDDVNDLGCLGIVGFPVAVANARPEVRAVAEYTTTAPGGRGAVREIAELILKARGVWDSLLETYR